MTWNKYNNGGGVPPMHNSAVPKYDAQGQGPIYGNFGGGVPQQHPDAGQDVIDGKLRAGEFVMKPEAVQAIGVDNLSQLNDSYTSTQQPIPQRHNSGSEDMGIQKLKKTDRFGNSQEITFDTKKSYNESGGMMGVLNDWFMESVPEVNQIPKPQQYNNGGPVGYAADGGWFSNWFNTNEDEDQNAGYANYNQQDFVDEANAPNSAAADSGFTLPEGYTQAPAGFESSPVTGYSGSPIPQPRDRSPFNSRSQLNHITNQIGIDSSTGGKYGQGIDALPTIPSSFVAPVPPTPQAGSGSMVEANAFGAAVAKTTAPMSDEAILQGGSQNTIPFATEAARMALEEANQAEQQQSTAVYDTIAGHEGFRDQAYQDSAGVWTIGYGRTTNPDGSPITPDQTTDQVSETATFQARVDQDRANVTNFATENGYNWSPAQIDALTSFTYNLGPNSLAQLTANGTRSNEEILAKIPEYNKAGGNVIQGLQTRRNDEAAMFSGIAGSPQGNTGDATRGGSGGTNDVPPVDYTGAIQQASDIYENNRWNEDPTRLDPRQLAGEGAGYGPPPGPYIDPADINAAQAAWQEQQYADPTRLDPRNVLAPTFKPNEHYDPRNLGGAEGYGSLGVPAPGALDPRDLGGASGYGQTGEVPAIAETVPYEPGNTVIDYNPRNETEANFQLQTEQRANEVNYTDRLRLERQIERLRESSETADDFRRLEAMEKQLGTLGGPTAEQSTTAQLDRAELNYASSIMDERKRAATATADNNKRRASESAAQLSRSLETASEYAKPAIEARLLEEKGKIAAAETAREEALNTIDDSFTVGNKTTGESRTITSDDVAASAFTTNVSAETFRSAEAKIADRTGIPLDSISDEDLKATQAAAIDALKGRDIDTSPVDDPDGTGGDTGGDVDTTINELDGPDSAEGLKSVFGEVFKDLFGDASFQQSIVKALVLYAGGRLTGMSGNQAIALASKAALAGGDQYRAKMQRENADKESREAWALTNIGKFKPASVKEYIKTGNIDSLKSATATSLLPSELGDLTGDSFFVQGVGRVETRRDGAGKGQYYTDTNGRIVKLDDTRASGLKVQPWRSEYSSDKIRTNISTYTTAELKARGTEVEGSGINVDTISSDIDDAIQQAAIDFPNVTPDKYINNARASVRDYLDFRKRYPDKGAVDAGAFLRNRMISVELPNLLGDIIQSDPAVTKAIDDSIRSEANYLAASDEKVGFGAARRDLWNEGKTIWNKVNKTKEGKAWKSIGENRGTSSFIAFLDAVYAGDAEAEALYDKYEPK